VLRGVNTAMLRKKRELLVLQNKRNSGKGAEKMFKKMRSVRLPYARQGLIFFTCLTYAAQPPEIKEKIEEICTDVAGPHRNALFEMITTNKSIYRICDECMISPTQMYFYRKLFYENW